MIPSVMDASTLPTTGDVSSSAVISPSLQAAVVYTRMQGQVYARTVTLNVLEDVRMEWYELLLLQLSHTHSGYDFFPFQYPSLPLLPIQ